MPTLLLTEIQLKQVIAILVESKKEEFLKKKYNVDDDVIEMVKEIDPTPNNKYTEWLIRVEAWKFTGTYIKKLPDVLKLYAKDNIRKSLPQKYQDINAFKSPISLISQMEDIDPANFVSKSEAYKQTYVGRAGKYKVYQPTTYVQSCKLGSGTRWCTSADSDEGRSSFKSYTEDDDILLIFIYGDDKFQYSTQGGEFKDKENKDVDIPKDILRWLVDNDMVSIDYKINKMGMSLEEALDGDLHVKGDLFLRDNKRIKELPNGLRVGGDLNLMYTNIEKLPDDLYVGGYMRLYGNKTLKELPDGLRVDGWLDIGDTNIEKLPDDLYIGRAIALENTPLTKYTDDEIRSMVKYIGGDIRRR